MDLTQALFNTQLGKNLRRVFLQTQVLTTSSSSIIFPQHDFPTQKHLFHNLVFRHAREHF